jgi:hypothetical protein
MSKGWISIHRELQEHWLWKEKREFSKLEAWLDILLTVNHSEQKVMIKNTLFTVKRGQSINSLETWGKRWKWSRGRVKRFLDLLKSDSMIDFRTNSKTTELTVCKYDSYQDTQTSNKHQTNIKRTSNVHQTNINNKDNNINKENNEEIIFKQPLKLSIWNDWLNYRKEIKKPIKVKSTLEILFKRFEKESLEKCKFVVNNSIENNYVGLFWDNYNEKTKENNKSSHNKIVF